MGHDRNRTPPARGGAAPPPRSKRALSGLRGGAVDRAGEPELAGLCAHALDVVASEQPLDFTHGFHSYPARFHPLLARRLLAALPAARRVLDPFVGSGTTLVEAALAGRTAYGGDVNPLSIMLARLKSTAVGPERSTCGPPPPPSPSAASPRARPPAAAAPPSAHRPRSPASTTPAPTCPTSTASSSPCAWPSTRPPPRPRPTAGCATGCC